MPEFRTATGQTGPDAYAFEAQAIANTQRELDARFQRLIAAIRSEHPELLRASTDFAFSGAEHARDLRHYLRGAGHYEQWLRDGKPSDILG